MLETVQAELGWPTADIVFNPPGSGASVVAELARNKIQQRIQRMEGGQNARVGVLTPNPDSGSTLAPLALVCEFNRPIPLATLHKLHVLAWNFSRTPLLITIEPQRLRAFSCCEQPEKNITDATTIRAEIPEAEYRIDQTHSLSENAAAALHWLNIASGSLQRRYPDRFDRRYAADNMLLDNLETIRTRLHENGLKYDLIHDLLARLIFIQFLFQRCDSSGTPALNSNHLKKLCQKNILSRPYENLGEILGHHGDTYALFRYLNDRFNGDLFPGKSDSEAQREKEWRKEMKSVQKKHLQLLREFVLGEMKIRSGQFALWPLYSFDTIPLEFVSSVYEAFVTKRKGTVYTPVHLVDFLLDGVLPWGGSEWDLKILDPACGSGIFLVRAFQRLVHRWKNANPDTPLRTEILKRLLTHNITGVDIDPHAIRVASFSLYLAMCDELDPRHYWQQIRFPKLRDERLICADFFSEEAPGLQTEKDAAGYDLVIGNPPWGKNQIKEVMKEFGSDAASTWVNKYSWPVSYGDSGTLFVAKALRLAKPEGVVSLLQPTQTLLLNQSGPAVVQRRKLFTEHQVVEVINLSALRFGLFKKAVGPSSIITVKPKPAEYDYSLTYIVVKPSVSADNDYRFVIDAYDVHRINSFDVEKNPQVFTALTWGGPRDLSLLSHLAGFPTIASLEKEGKLKSLRGIIRGDRKKLQKSIVGLRLFSDHDFPDNAFLSLHADTIPINDDPETHSRASTSLEPFAPPQLLIKLAWKRKTGRFRAIRLVSEHESVLCSDSYVSVSAADNDLAALNSACVVLNSRLATYHLLLTSAKFSNYRDITNVEEQLSVPCPPSETVDFKYLQSFDDIDRETYRAFGLKESEQALIDDLFEITLPFFKDGEKSIARQATQRATTSQEPELYNYLHWFLRVLNATFGCDNTICATLFEEPADRLLPIRLVAIHLDWPGRSPIFRELMDEGVLANKLTDLYKHLSGGSGDGPTCYRRVARVFDTIGQDGKSIPTIYIAKPDEKRYWTRAIAMRDADEIAAEIMLCYSRQQGNA